MTIPYGVRIDTRSMGRTSPERPVREALLLVLRDRVASRYYDRPEVVDALARSILQASAVSHS
jgi:hypothetical protein